MLEKETAGAATPANDKKCLYATEPTTLSNLLESTHVVATS